jgi:hypothetical protein
MREGRHQDGALSIGESGPGEATDGATEKIFVLVKLDDVVARCRFRHHMMPRFIRIMVKTNLHWRVGGAMGVEFDIHRKCLPSGT